MKTRRNRLCLLLICLLLLRLTLVAYDRRIRSPRNLTRMHVDVVGSFTPIGHLGSHLLSNLTVLWSVDQIVNGPWIRIEIVEFFRRCIAHAQLTQQLIRKWLLVLLSNRFVMQIDFILGSWITVFAESASDKQCFGLGQFDFVLHHIRNKIVPAVTDRSCGGLIASLFGTRLALT